MFRTSVAERSRGERSVAPTGRPDIRPLLVFAALALPIGWVLLTVPVVLGLPTEPFALAATLFALFLPALVLTARETGRAGVGALLRDAVRLPRPSWWGLAAILALPLVVWTAAVPLGGARPLTPALLGSFLIGLVITTVVINIWEETAWTGFVQRRAMARWGALGGSAITAALFAGIHLPLAFAGAEGPDDVLTGVGILVGTGIGLRLVIAGLDRWSGGSLLTVGILHGSFNTTPDLIDPAFDWLRYTAAIVLGVVVIAILRRRAVPGTGE
jgi:membrane protease YdiL (CAAX protease family)